MSLKREWQLRDILGQTFTVTLLGTQTQSRAEVQHAGGDAIKYDLVAENESVELRPELGHPFDDKNCQLATLRLIELAFDIYPELKHAKVTAPLAQSWERTAFFMDNPDLWARRVPAPEKWTSSQDRAHPVRPLPLPGKLYQRWIPQIQRHLSFELLDLEKHLDIFHEWHNQKRVSTFWELDQSREELRSYIEKVHSDPHHLPVIGSIDDVPVGYFEVYWTPEDRLGPYYEAEPYDRGFHMLIGNRDFLGGPYTFEFLRALGHWLFLDEPRTERIMAEPRHDNAKMLRYVEAFPVWKNLKTFDFPHKRACLLEFAKDRFLAGGYL